jgi:hypothetical protein
MAASASGSMSNENQQQHAVLALLKQCNGGAQAHACRLRRGAAPTTPFQALQAGHDRHRDAARHSTAQHASTAATVVQAYTL